MLGKGDPLFKPAASPRYLRLLEARALASGGVLLRYAPGAAPPATADG